MTDAYTTTLERYHQRRQAEADAVKTRLDSAAQRDATARGTWPAGTRVFDTVSGGEGVVEAHVAGVHADPGAVFVRLDGAGLVARPPELFIVRPTPPAAGKS